MSWKAMTAVVTTGILIATAVPQRADAESFDVNSDINGSLDTQVTIGAGMRTNNPSCGLTGDTSGSCGGGANTAQSSASDNGDLNYKAGQLFTAYAKVTPELLLHDKPNGIDFMARGTFLYDAAAADTQRTSLGTGGDNQIVENAKLLDLWVSKDVPIGDHDLRVRAGNQVINWGESLFLYGGINATNAIDYQKSLIPGTQIKEYVLPAPMISMAGDVAPGLTMEGYYQAAYNSNIYPPVGSFWSAADFLGQGNRDIVTFNSTNYNQLGQDPATILREQGIQGRINQGQITALSQQILLTPGGADGVVGGMVLPDKHAEDQGQFGISAHYKPSGSVVDLGFYYLRYHDKAPVLNYVSDSNVSAGTDFQWSYQERRDLFGVSTNFPLGNWAIGSELSYRPRDAISLSGCYTPGAAPNANNAGAGGSVVFANSQACPAYKDNQKYELHLTGLLALTPSDNPTVINALKADTAFLSIEAVGVDYPGVGGNITRTVNGVEVVQMPASGYVTWLNGAGNPKAVGSELSGGAVVDFNWTYDGTAIPGWQLTPGITYFNALFGQTPTFSATYMAGSQSANFYLLFNQNPSVWQAGLNFTAFWGGSEAWDNPYRDRDLVGAFVTRNF